ncbi:MAG: DUF4350 domain-containing protein [Methanomassiliicoccales archaeon]
MKRYRMVILYITMAAAVLLVLFFSLAAPILSSNAGYSVYNGGWDGCSDMAVRTYQAGKFTPNLELSDGRQLEVTQKPIDSYRVEPNSSSILIMGPQESFTQGQASYLHDFLQAGGTVLLAGDLGGQGNSLLGGLNTSSSFVQSPVLDLSFSKDPHFGVSYGLTEDPLTEGVDTVLLNHPAGLDPDENATTLMNTSEASWIDRNGNGAPDPGEARGGVPLMSVEPYGRGELILVSDASIFINSMRGEMDNSRLVGNILDHVSEGRSNIIFDESHREVELVYSVAFRGDYPSRAAVAAPVLIAVIVAALLIAPEGPRRLLDRMLLPFRKEDGRRDAVDQVLEEHPEWDERKLRRVKEGFVDEGDHENGRVSR